MANSSIYNKLRDVEVFKIAIDINQGIEMFISSEMVFSDAAQSATSLASKPDFNFIISWYFGKMILPQQTKSIF